MDILKSVNGWFVRFVQENGDPYVNNYPLMNNFSAVLGVTSLYIGFVIFGPRLMASRQPFGLRNILILYNLFVTLLSLYMTVEYFLASTSSPSYSLSCFPADRDGSPYGSRLRNVSWLYFFSKIIEFADTIFFILRKKNNQVTFLHVYHHTNLAIFGWMGVRFVPTGETYFLAMLNSGVHVIMYFYYMMAAMGPQWQKYLWWKRYLTQIQLIQFVSILVHYSYIAIFNHEKCDFPRGVLIAYSFNSISFFLLFMHFYRLAYKSSRKEQPISQEVKGAQLSSDDNNDFHARPDTLTYRNSPRKED